MLPSQLLATATDGTADPSDDLRCPICFALMLAPRKLPGCGVGAHTFCAPCIIFWLQLQRDAGLSPSCPIDRRIVGMDEKPEVDVAVEAAVQKLTVRCPNAKLGCQAQFALGEGVGHLRTCLYRTVQCPKCGKPQSAEKLERHRENCFKQCTACSTLVPRADSLTHSMNLCLARPHIGWWSVEAAKAFCIFRDASSAQLGELLSSATPVAPVTDWRRANTLLHELLDRTREQHTALVEAGAAHGSSASWQASAPLCLSLAAECRTRGWRGPWLAFSLKAADLDPTSLDARMRCAEALLGCGKASEACEAYEAARLLDVPSSAGDDGMLEAICGEAAALDQLKRADEASALWARARKAPQHNAPPQPSAKERWVVAVPHARPTRDLLAALHAACCMLHAASLPCHAATIA